MNVGIFPCKSNKVWSFTAALVLQSAQCPFKLKRLLMDQLKPKKVAVVAMASKNVRGVPAVLFFTLNGTDSPDYLVA